MDSMLVSSDSIGKSKSEQIDAKLLWSEPSFRVTLKLVTCSVHDALSLICYISSPPFPVLFFCNVIQPGSKLSYEGSLIGKKNKKLQLCLMPDSGILRLYAD